MSLLLSYTNELLNYRYKPCQRHQDYDPITPLHQFHRTLIHRIVVFQFAVEYMRIKITLFASGSKAFPPASVIVTLEPGAAGA